jgi:hypothetical protein
MKFWVGVTDRLWFEDLRALGLDEVNFSQPSAWPPATLLKAAHPWRGGQLFIFRHSFTFREQGFPLNNRFH